MFTAPQVTVYSADHVTVRQQQLHTPTGRSFVVTYYTFFDDKDNEMLCVAAHSDGGLRTESVNEPSEGR